MESVPSLASTISGSMMRGGGFRYGKYSIKQVVLIFVHPVSTNTNKIKCRWERGPYDKVEIERENFKG